MKLSEEEITKHLLDGAKSLGRVESLLSQSSEYFSSFKNDHREQLKGFTEQLKELSGKIDTQIERYSTNMNKKIEDNSKACDINHQILLDRVETLESHKDKQSGFLSGISWLSGLIYTSGGALAGWIANKIFP